MICDKCKEDFTETTYKTGETYKGIDEHHNPPKFLFKKKSEWKGKTYFLCRDDHVELHRQIKIILNKIAGTLKFCNSEDWLCKKMCDNQILIARGEVYNFTEEWIKK
jgi:hypothetical protein